MPNVTEPPTAETAVPCCPPLTTPGLSPADAATMAAMFKALSDPARVLLFSRVASHPGGEACVCDLGDVGVSQPTVSHHLKKLRQAGLLTSERRGTWVYYRVAPGVLAAMGAMLAERAGPAREPSTCNQMSAETAPELPAVDQDVGAGKPARAPGHRSAPAPGRTPGQVPEPTP
ncbi:transcriptional regulator [Streptomyces armeniacus]|uniref:Transcriptional regulator n=1 Tax=Streptomyces armeniacus TaxID=83291 RepID=A0A345XZ08_9ACTN|nr:transcriptional regulator [Streptomyces armeniacus]